MAAGALQALELGDLELELGGVLRRARLVYTTHGTLNDARDNAVLYPHMYASKPASLASTIAPGRALDPERFFVVCPAMLGGGLSSSPSTTPGPFPEVTIGDDVSIQHRLVTQLGIERLALVVGFSMGAQQAYEWAVRFPALVDRLAPIAGTARTTAANELQVRLAQHALESGGASLHGLAFMTHGLGRRLLRDEGWREAGFASVDDLLQRLFVDDFASQHAGDLACLCAKWRRADVARHAGGDLAAALGRITARTTVIAFSDDPLFPVRELAAEAALVPGATMTVIESPWGHWAWEMTASWRTRFDGALRALLAR